MHNLEPGVQEQEQLADITRQAIARDDPAVRGHESLQRAAAREEPGVQEQEQPADTVRRAIAREVPGVREHESEQRAAACNGVQVRTWGVSISSALWLME